MPDDPELIFFDEPPTIGHGGRPADPEKVAWLTALTEHPGKWAKFPKEQLSAAMVRAIKVRGAYGVGGRWEAVTRGTPNKHYWIFACYLGPEDGK